MKLRDWIIFKGLCLGGGNSEVRISGNKNLLIYIYHNSSHPKQIPLNIDNLIVNNHLVCLKELKIVEHLFSALYGLNLFNVRIEVTGEEIPFFDGSSKLFTEHLLSLEESKRAPIRVKEIFLKEKNSFIHYRPWSKSELLIDMELSHPYIKRERLSIIINRENYINEIASARTFVFTTEEDPRLKNLPPYGIGITKNHTFSSEALRFPDEPVRHKILDLLGDLYVLQRPLCGIIRAFNTSHRINLKFARTILQDKIATKRPFPAYSKPQSAGSRVREIPCEDLEEFSGRG
uniref:UDP-3-O-acyl-N-acetylglucosamine deacetylase n=1 Tax=candidate division WOR-3 bacterium TaxID=2052148 RepID=A0A7C4XKG2_UNCW3